ncbi:potassium channel family protein [uncultured Cocleimonas sp.]|uniref:potassium channel family protein n=1 Tax=uncultured Cocleimonas sp. TaxID=1051587 RepID=UPI002638EA1B|nr:potassium channel family protein [uncultured Cocleimonas sp.]
MDLTFAFLYKFFWAVVLTFPTLILFSIVIAVLGLVVGKKEGWTNFDAIYWAFITALTVGYGDLRPTKKSSRIFALLISVIGIMLFGIVVAITVNTFGSSLQEQLASK